MQRIRLGEAASDEIEARAAEQIVCRDFGIDCGSVERWAHIACIESIKSGIVYPSLSWFVDRVNERMKTQRTRANADRVIELGIIRSK